MLRIAVCDDDFYFANKFEKTLHILIGDKSSRIDVFTNPKNLIAAEVVYDFVFLDIKAINLAVFGSESEHSVFNSVCTLCGFYCHCVVNKREGAVIPDRKMRISF